MKVATIFEDGSAGVSNVPNPKSINNVAVVKVRVAPMCTEYKALLGNKIGNGFGHEAVGEVVEIARPGKVHVGDRVVVQPGAPCGTCYICLGGDYIHCEYGLQGLPDDFNQNTSTMAQFLNKVDWLLTPIPDNMSYEHASMACCGLGPTYGAVRKMNVNSYDAVLITGLGAVGLGGVINSTYLGAKVIGVDPNPYRAELALDLGASAVFDPNEDGVLDKIKQETDGQRGVDKAMDCSGNSSAHRLMIDAVRRKGEVSFIGEGKDFPLFASADMLRKGISLHGIWHYNLSDTLNITKVIERNSDKLDKFITHKFPMTQVQKAWELQATMNCGKVLLDPWL